MKGGPPRRQGGLRDKVTTVEAMEGRRERPRWVGQYFP